MTYPSPMFLVPRFVILYLLQLLVVQNCHATSLRSILQRATRSHLNQNQNQNPNHDRSTGPITIDDVDELYLTQTLNHFEPSPTQNQTTFSQRYFYSARYVHSSTPSSPPPPPPPPPRPPLLRTTNTTTTTTQTPTSQQQQPSSTNLAFLCIGGEGPPLTPSVLVDSVHCTGDMLQLARLLHQERGYNVHLFALEHRYYGRSLPNGTLATTTDAASGGGGEGIDMRYLSSRQAIADIAKFVPYVTQFHNLSLPFVDGSNHTTTTTNTTNTTTTSTQNRTQWITFGGSYPGILSAYTRLILPYYIHASISNSAPIQPTLDFYQYNQVVGSALRNTQIGGSDTCYDIVQRGHEEVSLLLVGWDNTQNSYGRDTVAELFGICGGGSSLGVEETVRVFLGDGVVDLPVQGNDPSCKDELCNIEKICTFLTTSTDPPLQTLAHLSQNQTYPSPCKDISYKTLLTYLRSTEAVADGTYPWFYQTCTEFGFYQTCPLNSTCPYGRGYHTIDLDLTLCETLFGISPEAVERNVQDTLEYYGGWNIGADRILSVNGDVDPWSALSLNVKKDRKDGEYDPERLPTYWSRGASHHFWTHPVEKTDGEGIMKTREIIFGWVIGLLDGEGEGVVVEEKDEDMVKDEETRVGVGVDLDVVVS